jgi:hypothetical protein
MRRAWPASASAWAASSGLRSRAEPSPLVTATFLIDLLAPALRLPDWVDKLALSTHLGQPMIGSWEWTGITAFLPLAAGPRPRHLGNDPERPPDRGMT